MTKTVTNISKLSPTHFVSNIRHQHRCSLFPVKIKTINVSLNQPNSNPSSIGSNRRSLPPSYDAMFGSKTTVESIFKNDSFKNSKQASFDDEAESVKGLSDWTEL